MGAKANQHGAGAQGQVRRERAQSARVSPALPPTYSLTRHVGLQRYRNDVHVKDREHSHRVRLALYDGGARVTGDGGDGFLS